MSRRKARTCPYCRIQYRSDCCPVCREERLHMQSTYQPGWDEIMDEEREERIARRNGERPYYSYDYGLDE